MTKCQVEEKQITQRPLALPTLPLRPARAAEGKKTPRKHEPAGEEPRSKSPEMLLFEISFEIMIVSKSCHSHGHRRNRVTNLCELLFLLGTSWARGDNPAFSQHLIIHEAE